MTYSELIKLKRNPTGLALVALAFLFPLAVLLADHMSGENVSVSSSVQPWLQAPLVVVFLLGAYLLTLEPAVGTEKWLWTTPLRPERLALAKVTTTALVALASFLFAAGIYGTLPGGKPLLYGGLAALSSLLTVTWLSGLLRSFAGVLVASVIWSQAAPFLYNLLPEGVRGLAWSVLPALGLTHFEDAAHNATRIGAHVFYLLLAYWVWARRAR